MVSSHIVPKMLVLFITTGDLSAGWEELSGAEPGAEPVAEPVKSGKILFVLIVDCCLTDFLL